MKSLLITILTMMFLWVPSFTTASTDYSYLFPSEDEQQTLKDTNYIENQDDAFLNEDPYALTNETENVSESYSNLPDKIASQGERVFIFSPRLLRWAAYDSDGYLVATGKANGGADFCPQLGRPCRTPIGSFRVGRKGDSSCVSSKFPLGQGGAAMPYCMFFTSGDAIHGSPYISNHNTSHGCIRVYTDAAAWLSRYFLHVGTKVIVLPY